MTRHALLGMTGFVVLATSEEGEPLVLVETTAARAGCSTCGDDPDRPGAFGGPGPDLSAGGRAVRLVWRQRRWLCRELECEQNTFTEDNQLVEGSITRRAAGQICRHDGRDGHSVASVDGTSASPGERRWARRQGTPLVDDEARLRGGLSVDVHKMLAASKTRNTLYARASSRSSEVDSSPSAWAERG